MIEFMFSLWTFGGVIINHRKREIGQSGRDSTNLSTKGVSGLIGQTGLENSEASGIFGS